MLAHYYTMPFCFCSVQNITAPKKMWQDKMLNGTQYGLSLETHFKTYSILMRQTKRHVHVWMVVRCYGQILQFACTHFMSWHILFFCSIIIHIWNIEWCLTQALSLWYFLFMPEFIEVVKNYDATKRKWLPAELELKRHKELMVKSDIAQAALEVKLKKCRYQVNVEIKKRYKPEADFQHLVWIDPFNFVRLSYWSSWFRLWGQ